MTESNNDPILQKSHIDYHRSIQQLFVGDRGRN